MTRKTVASLLIIVAAIFAASRSSLAAPQRQAMPYTTVDHPEFIPASQAAFMSPGDLLIGISTQTIAKAYPAALLAQHGAVQDHMPDGPIAITW